MMVRINRRDSNEENTFGSLYGTVSFSVSYAAGIGGCMSRFAE